VGGLERGVPSRDEGPDRRPVVRPHRRHDAAPVRQVAAAALALARVRGLGRFGRRGPQGGAGALTVVGAALSCPWRRLRGGRSRRCHRAVDQSRGAAVNRGSREQGVHLFAAING
jgi:hypothetical protein